MAIVPSQKCGKCGYELAGLGVRGNCPECGNRFDRQTGLGFDSPAGSVEKADRMLLRLRTYAFVALAACIMVCGGVFEWMNQNNRAIWIAMLLAGVALLGALTSYVYEGDK